MKQSIVHIALVVRDYDEAITFYTEKLTLHLSKIYIKPEQDKRWVVVSPWLQAEQQFFWLGAPKPEQLLIGNQAGGRVISFLLTTDDFWSDYNEMVSKGIKFLRRAPKENLMDWLLYLKIYMEIYGIYYNLMPIIRLFKRN